MSTTADTTAKATSPRDVQLRGGLLYVLTVTAVLIYGLEGSRWTLLETLPGLNHGSSRMLVEERMMLVLGGLEGVDAVARVYHSEDDSGRGWRLHGYLSVGGGVGLAGKFLASMSDHIAITVSHADEVGGPQGVYLFRRDELLP